MDINEYVALRIKEIRINKGLSQEKLALLAEVDRTYMQSIETGQRNISLNVFIKICEALEVKASDILIGYN